MAHIKIVVHTDSCLSWTGASGGRDYYWLGTSVTPWVDDVQALAAAGEPAKAVVKLLLAPWHWSAAAWVTTGSGTPETHPGAGAFPRADLVASLDKRLSDLFVPPWTSLTAPAGTPEAGPNWALTLAQLARGPAPAPQVLGLCLVSRASQPAPTDQPSRVLQSVTAGGLTFVVGQPPVAAGVDTIEVVTEFAHTNGAVVASAPSPPIGDLAPLQGLIHGRSRLVLSKAETSRNWLTELQRRLGRALDPLARLADVADAVAAQPAPPAAFTAAAVRLAAQAALNNLLGALVSGGAGVLELIATEAVVSVDPLADRAFARAWGEAIKAALPRSDSLIYAWTGETAPKDLDAPIRDGGRADWGASLRRRFTSLQFRTALVIFLTETLDAAASSSGTSRPYGDIARRWLADDRNRSTLLASLLPLASGGDYYRTTLSTAMALTTGSEEARVSAAAAQGFPSALRALLAWPATAPVDDPPLMAVGAAALAGALASPETVDAVALGGVALRIDEVLPASPPPAPASPPEDYHNHFDGWVLAVRRSANGLSSSSKDHPDSAGLIGTLGRWEAPFIATRANIAYGASPAAAGILVGSPVNFSGSQEKGSRIRRAIVTYRGQYMIPHSTGGDGSPILAVTYHLPTEAAPPLAYGQVVQARAAFLGLGGIAPAGWSDPSRPWLSGPVDPAQLETTFSDKPLAPAMSDVLLPKTTVLLRSAPPGPPRLLVSAGDLDGTQLSAALTGPNDAAVPALWKERLKSAPEALRKRFEKAASCFLDFLAPDDRVSFVLRPPALAVGARKDDTDQGQVWRYWTQRDADAGDPEAGSRLAAFKNRGDTLAYDDPAIVYPPRTGMHNGLCGGCLVKIIDLADGSAVRTQVVRFDAAAAARAAKDANRPDAGPLVTVNINATPIKGAPSITPVSSPMGQQLNIALDHGKTYGISFQTFADPNFFSGGSDPRFDRALVSAAANSDTLPAWGPADSATSLGDGTNGYLFGESVLVAETLPDDDHMPAPEAIWQAMSLAQSGARVTADFYPAVDDAAFAYVASVQATRQWWEWDGGPVAASGVRALFTDPLIESGAADPAVVGHAARRMQKFVDFESAMMLVGAAAGVEENPVHLNADGASARLFTLDLPDSRGAGYLRTRVEATSRYAPLRQDRDQAKLIVHGRATGNGGQADEWLGMATRLRRSAPLASPKIRIAAPLFGAASPAAPAAGEVIAAAGFAVMLDETAFDAKHGAGLGEQLIAEVVIERLDVNLAADSVEVNPSKAGKTAALALGMDPAAGPEQDPFTTSVQTPGDASSTAYPRWAFFDQNKWTPPAPGIWSPAIEDGPAATFRLAAVLGETLEPSSDRPQFPFASALFEAVINPVDPSIGPRPLKPGTFARVRFRFEPLPVATEGGQAAAKTLSSAWSQTIWIQLTSRMDYDHAFALARPQWNGASVTFTLNAESSPEADHVFARWAGAPNRADGPVGPSLRLQAIAGLVVRDAGGAQVLRPKVLLTGVVDAANRKVVFTADQGRLGETEAPVFLQVLEVHDYNVAPNPTSQDLGAAATDWLASDQNDASRRIVGFGPRYFSLDPVTVKHSATVL